MWHTCQYLTCYSKRRLAECCELNSLKHFQALVLPRFLSECLFTVVPRYVNSVTGTKDTLKRLGLMWNCKCCKYTGSIFCLDRIVCHFTDRLCMAVSSSSIVAIRTCLGFVSMLFISLYCSNIRFFTRNARRRWNVS